MTEGDVINPYIFIFTPEDGGGDDGDLAYEGNPDWDLDGDGVLDNYNDYENNGSVTARVYDADGNDISASGDIIAAFIDGEQRGVAAAEGMFGANVQRSSTVAWGILLVVFCVQYMYLQYYEVDLLKHPLLVLHLWLLLKI